MVQDDPKLLDDGGEIPSLKEKVDGLISGCEVSSPLDQKLVMW